MTSEEKQIRQCQSKQLIDALSKMPAKVIATAYLHAINYTRYGEDVTEKWVTATQNASALEKAYKKGYYDALNGVEDCRNCKKWDECPCGKEGHSNGTSIGYSIGECKEYEPCEETREMLTADERALFLNKLTHWLKDNFNDIVIGGWQDNDGEIFDLFFIKRERKTVKED